MRPLFLTPGSDSSLGARPHRRPTHHGTTSGSHQAAVQVPLCSACYCETVSLPCPEAAQPLLICRGARPPQARGDGLDGAAVTGLPVRRSWRRRRMLRTVRSTLKTVQRLAPRPGRSSRALPARQPPSRSPTAKWRSTGGHTLHPTLCAHACNAETETVLLFASSGVGGPLDMVGWTVLGAAASRLPALALPAPGAVPGSLERLGEALRAEVEELSVEVAEIPKRMTVVIGVLGENILSLRQAALGLSLLQTIEDVSNVHDFPDERAWKFGDRAETAFIFLHPGWNPRGGVCLVQD